MEILKTVAIIYLVIGFLYALYILLFAGDGWFSLFFNTLFGPVYFIKVVWDAFTRKSRSSLKEIFENKKLVIFDMDGTIIDSQAYWDQAMDNVKKKHKVTISKHYPSGLNVEEKWMHTLKRIENKLDAPIKELAPKLAVETEQEFLKLYKDIEPFSGFWGFAKELKERGMKLALASNTKKSVVDEIVKRMEAEQVFDFIIGGDEVKKRKPNPEMYKKVMKEFKTNSKHTLIFEDTVVGATAAIKSKTDTIVVWDGEVFQDMYPKGIKLWIPDFTGLIGNLDKTWMNMLEESAKFVEETGIEVD
jgi:beta-phosphoglucomutase